MDTALVPRFVFDDQSVNRNLIDDGEAFSRGIDLTINKKTKDGLYGSFTASLFETKYEDFNGNWRNRDYDVELMLGAVGGYRFNKNWEISGRWTYMGSRPYTPINTAKSSQASKTIRNVSRYNEGRLPSFHSLYLRVDRRFFLDQFTITGFIETWNSYDRENIEEKYWNTNSKSVDAITQFDLLPVGGFKIHF